MKYPPSFFRNSIPEWKRKKDPLLCRLFYRPVSYFVSSLAASAGISANAVSFFSIFVALFGCGALLLDMPIVGAILFNVWLVLDCVDGNLARSVKKQLYGDFADSLSSYLCVGFMFVTMGYYVFHHGGIVVVPGSPEIIVLGGMASSSDALARLSYQKFLNSSNELGIKQAIDEDGSGASKLDKVRIKVDAAVSLGGNLPIIILLAVIPPPWISRHSDHRVCVLLHVDLCSNGCLLDTKDRDCKHEGF